MPNHSPIGKKLRGSREKFRGISAIDARLTEFEQEKQQLIALREKLQKTRPTPPISDSLSPEQKIAIFRNLSHGHSKIFANRWQSQQGRNGYSVACNNEWIQRTCNKLRIKCQDCNHPWFSELNDQVIYRHLAGHWQDEVKAISRACVEYALPHAKEISRCGNGAHLWIFFYDKVPADKARLVDFGLLDKSMEVYPNLSFDSYDRLLPNQVFCLKEDLAT